MNQARITKYAQTAGRVNTVNGFPQEATVSPIAAPSTFALRNGLRIEHIVREETGDGLAVALMLKNQDGNATVVSGKISANYDDHAITRFEDLDFVAEADATEELHIALEELFGYHAPAQRRKLLRTVA